jgi:hypothetical protein
MSKYIDSSSTQYLDAPPLLRLESLRDAIAKDIPEQKFVLPNFIPEAGNVIVGVGVGVDPSMWNSLLAYGVATGRGLAPFGKTEASPVLWVGRQISTNRTIHNLKLVLEKDTSLDYRDLAVDNLFLFRGQLSDSRAGYLNDIKNVREIEQKVPTDCKVVFFYDGKFALSKPKKPDNQSNSVFAEHVQRLNEAGIATVIFHQTGRHGAEPLLDQLLPEGGNYCVDLTINSEAPCEFGSGFNVLRKKTSEYDSSPTFFQVWHMVINKKLSFGWEIRDKTHRESKKVEITERQMRLKHLLDSGMPQKEAASILKVHEATISRDAAEIRSNSYVKRQKFSGQDDLAESNGDDND